MSGVWTKRLSKHVGVKLEVGRDKWRVHTGGGNSGARLEHGWYDTENDAARARNAAMIARYGYDPNPCVIDEAPAEAIRYSVTGEAEFIVRSLNRIRKEGNAVLYIIPRERERIRLTQIRLKSLMPLLRAQPYLYEVLFGDQGVSRVNLDVCPLETDGPWLFVDEVSPVAKVVAHRSGTFKSAPAATWASVCSRLGTDCAFVGTRFQKQAFKEATFVEEIRSKEPKDLLEFAKILAGAEMFIGNKSALSAIADGLGVKTVLEWTKEFVELAEPACPMPALPVHADSQSLV